MRLRKSERAVFLCYQKLDSPFLAAQVRQRLVESSKIRSVFQDLHSIGSGDDSRLAIDSAIDRSEVMVLVMGPHWDPERLSVEGDFVAYELRRARRRSIPIVPVLADGRSMPGEGDWPADLEEIRFRQAQAVRSGPEHDGDLSRLLNRVIELSPEVKKDQNSSKVWALTAALAVLIAVFGFLQLTQGQDDENAGTEETEDSDSDNEANTGAGEGLDGTETTQPGGPGGSCIELDMAVSTEKAELLKGFASSYNNAGLLTNGRCVDVSVSAVTSGLARQALVSGWESGGTGAPEPQAWSPTSSIWLSVLEKEWADKGRDDDPQDLGSLAQSPLTIAMREPMAEALGWPEEPLGWSDVLDLINAPGGWASRGHPEWGPFTMGKDNPERSTSGMAATVAVYYAASGESGDLTLDNIRDPAVREFVAGVERGVVRYSDEALKFLAKFAEAEAQAEEGAPPYVSAVLMQEQLVYLYNTGNPTGQRDAFNAERPRVPLVAISPNDGTLMMDHPFVVLPSASEDQRQVAEGFFSFLQETAQQQMLQAAGFRNADGIAGDMLVLETGALADRPPVIEPPSAEVVDQILDDWTDLRKKVRLLVLYDVSGSMDDPVREGEPTTRNDVAKQAAIDALDQLSPDDEVGLWTFSSERVFGTEPYSQRVEPFLLDDGHKSRLTASLEDIRPTRGDTALYRTVRDAVAFLRSQDDPALINTVLVLSDGINDEGDGADTDAANDAALERLLEDLDGDGQPPIRIFAIALDKQSDFVRMERMALATDAVAYDARDPSTIDDAFLDIISNF